ncbi:MAG: UDP-N-acetylmuramoyl-tripeptide--D-alanyl-D-alanine ligase [Myxococcota bacterium]
MTVWHLDELARAIEGEISGGVLPVSIEAVGTDTRSLPPASLFVALRGANFDGHHFIKQAVQSGAREVLVDRAGYAAHGPCDVPMLVVDDTLKALGDMAAYTRGLHHKPVVAITGSNGKTTTKELCAAALAARGRVHRTAGNFNNLIGLPLTLLQWREQTWAAVVEMGMSMPGEIDRLAQIAAPDVGLITNVACAHLQGFKDLDQIGHAKGELFARLEETATAVINLDDSTIMGIAVPKLSTSKRITFGRHKMADVRCIEAHTGIDGTRVTLGLGESTLHTDIPLLGEHNLYNSAGALACALAVGLRADEALAAMSLVEPAKGRLHVMRDVCFRGGEHLRKVQVIDDTYNANPASAKVAFRALERLAPNSRRVVILGDMLELGADAAALHHEVGSFAGEVGIDWLLCFGQYGASVAQGAREVDVCAEHFDDVPSLLNALRNGLRDDDSILVKGSRGMSMDRFVTFMVGETDGVGGGEHG